MYKIILWIVLLIATLFLLYLGFKSELQPPIWTAIGFIAIGLLLVKRKE